MFHLILALSLSVSFQTKTHSSKTLVVPRYKGVTPPSPKLPKQILKPGGKCTLVWPGFQLKSKPGGSRFFFLFTRTVSLKTKIKKIKRHNVLRLRIRHCKAWKKNAWRDLITHFFPTPIEKVSFYKDSKKKDLVIDLEYKKSVINPKITHTIYQGYYLLLLEWPKYVEKISK